MPTHSTSWGATYERRSTGSLAWVRSNRCDLDRHCLLFWHHRCVRRTSFDRGARAVCHSSHHDFLSPSARRDAAMTLDPTILARIQFAFTVSFHIIFPTISIGLAMFLAVV